MVYRVFVEKKPGVSNENVNLLSDFKDFLGVRGLTDIKIWNRYDAENIDGELFEYAKNTVFSEPMVDNVSRQADTEGASRVFAVRPLPGQFDQRADSAAQCIQMLSRGERPTVVTAKVYALYGNITDGEYREIKKYLINPVESCEVSLEKPETLISAHDEPKSVAKVEGFTEMSRQELSALCEKMGLAMDADDLKCLQDYFKNTEKRQPTVTEIKVVDTYWSDHCRHTTFSTHLENIDIEREDVKSAYENYLSLREEVYGKEKAAARPKTLMDIATIGAKVLKKRGLLPELDESEEINACSIHVSTNVDGETQDWLLMFKNETHNHPTEIEPFGGAATCIGGCIRDPLSGRAYVHQAMRISGTGDPRRELSTTLPGKLPQRKLAQISAAGNSSYGNQIGLATGHVAEIYHQGYIAKHLECGAVVAAAPSENVVRKRPQPGDVVILLGGRTGRDGIGGATGSSKSHNLKSLTTMASEVQKGNAPEERKIQRLFRDGEVTKMIKRCNDFGAGGVSVAIGELADGLMINLDLVRKKYDGLDGTEIAISESQERMAVVVAKEDREKFIARAEKENLEAYPVATVTESPRMVMTWRGETIADLSREFLNTNGSVKHADVLVEKNAKPAEKSQIRDLKSMAGSLQSASRVGLTERFDSTVGRGTVIMPFGGKTQSTPSQAMAALMPVLPGHETDTASLMAWGCDPQRLSADCFNGAYGAVYTSVAKIVASGADYKKAYLTLQEFFEKLRKEPGRWGKPFRALLGALQAQTELSAAAIGGKDSMSGTFLDMDVPPTVISFAVAPINAKDIITTEFKQAGNNVYLFGGENGREIKKSWEILHALMAKGGVKSAWAVENGLAEAVMKMSFGNEIGFKSDLDIDWYKSMPGYIVAEVAGDREAVKLGETTAEAVISLGGEKATVKELKTINEGVLEGVYPTKRKNSGHGQPVKYTYNSQETVKPKIKVEKPKALIPVFPGTNCEYDTQRALLKAGADAEIYVIRNLTASDVANSVKELAEKIRQSNIVVIPGGFSGGDEPDGSAKFITAFFRNPEVKRRVSDLLDNRDGLMLGICNGFQALIKLGLVPYGKIIDTDENCPTLTFNKIGRHQSKIVRVRVASNKSPWLKNVDTDRVYSVPISHGEGRFLASDELVKQLAENGQIATQYVDLQGNVSFDEKFNPNGSVEGIEGILSPDGRVFGKMGHAERIGDNLYKNVIGEYDMQLFKSAVEYFTK